MCGLPTTQQSDDQEQVFFVEAMSSYIILMMPKNQELRKFQRFKNQDSRLKIQESREDSIKISIKKVFQNIE